MWRPREGEDMLPVEDGQGLRPPGSGREAFQADKAEERKLNAVRRGICY